MRERRNTPHLKVVPPRRTPTAEENRGCEETPVQPALFPMTPQSLLGLVNMARISADEFTSVLQTVRPRWVFDLRPLPRFDLESLSRKAVFNLFQRFSISYQDVAGLIGVSSHGDARLNPGIVSNSLLDLASGSSGKVPLGPLVILLDSEEYLSASARLLPKLLKPRPRGGWTVRIYGNRERYWR